MTEKNYYTEKLSAHQLKQCYEIASQRIQQHLNAEINFTLEHIKDTDVILELGCGYGRALAKFAPKALEAYGIDISEASIHFARDYLGDFSNIHLYQMDAQSLNFPSETFDVVIAIQNAISSFKIPPEKLIIESMRVTKPNGKIILSSYSEKIWDARLEWFIQQSNEGLLGEIDLGKTGKGKIICKDGFEATTYTEYDFKELIEILNLNAEVVEIDDSSIFLIISSY